MILIIKYNLSYNYKKFVLLYFNYYKNYITKNKNFFLKHSTLFKAVQEELINIGH